MSDDTTRGPGQDGAEHPVSGSVPPPPAPPAYGTPPQAPAGYGAQNPPAAPAYAPPTGPAYGQGGYGQPPQGYPAAAPYGAAQGYPAAAPYGAAQGYPASYTPYPAEPKTNVLAIISLIASIVGFIWIIPFLGGLAGAIMGHVSLGQIKKNGEKGRGLAMAGIIVGWVGVGLFVIGAILFFSLIAASAGNGTRYGA